jgi:hypothetical protein
VPRHQPLVDAGCCIAEDDFLAILAFAEIASGIG